MSGFTIFLPALAPGASTIQLEAEAESLGLEPRVWPGTVIGKILVEMNGDRVSVRGRLDADAHLECVRCLREFDMPVTVPFEVFAERAATHPGSEERELERDGYLAFHDGRDLNLNHEARDALLLELPMAPCCREDCAGLCPRCGVDRNQDPCTCNAK